MSKDPSLPTATTTTAALEAGIRETRADVAADVRALKTQLTPENLKHRAIDLAERSVESIALQAARRLRAIPLKLVRSSREHPLLASAVGLALALVVWKASARRRRR